MQKEVKSNAQFINVAIGFAVIGIFILDIYTQLGISEWVFYLIILCLCLLQPHTQTAIIVAGVETVLLVAGFFASPPGINPEMALINRFFGLISIWAMAFMIRKSIKVKVDSLRLLWLQRGNAVVAESVLGEKTLQSTADSLLNALAKYVKAKVAVLHHIEIDNLMPLASYAYQFSSEVSSIKIGQGLAGQVARDGNAVIMTDVPPGYLQVSSGLGSSEPTHLLIAPMKVNGRVTGVIELAFVSSDSDFSDELELAKLIEENTGVALRSAVYRQRLAELLEETQRQTAELQAQQEELKVSNEELEEQSTALRESQGRLELQQAELEQTNVQLEEQTQQLERQKHELLSKQKELLVNAQEVKRAYLYKTEFLANMSHELRTPLNSSMILAKLFADNKLGTLSEEQVKYAKTIYAANNDLLTLINDILDLSKIEAGKIDLHIDTFSIDDLISPIQQIFEPIAEEKALSFNVKNTLPSNIKLETDSQRLQQILKNLLSNAFKFTEAGEVILSIEPISTDRVAFSVRDTGIGIPEHQQNVIFEAFRQADGTINRKFGGTGLGLSISRELARILQGEIRVQSSSGQGSTFTFEVPLKLVESHQQLQAKTLNIETTPNTQSERSSIKTDVVIPLNETKLKSLNGAHVEDDRDRRSRAGKLILVIEDDQRFAKILYDLIHEMDFDCLHVSTAQEAIDLARKYQPSGILMDIGLPDESGLSLLERMKSDPLVRHIPIHMISAYNHAQVALELGAIGYVLKPAQRNDLVQAINKIEEKLSKRLAKVLVIEDDATLRDNISLLLKAEDVEIVAVGTVHEALEQVKSTTIDCIVLDLMLPDMPGYVFLEQMAEAKLDNVPPVIVYTGRALTRDEEHKLRRYSTSIIVKGARSPERLLDEVTLFLHRVESALPEGQQDLLRRARSRDAIFEDRTILLAEDDVRNIFALSKVLEPLGVKLELARNGREALDRLSKDNAIDVVLMDIMMPEMDGLTAIRAIRNELGLKKLPIIAITAKAMPNDRQECLTAGANDYIAKPVDIDKLISLCKVWMPK